MKIAISSSLPQTTKVEIIAGELKSKKHDVKVLRGLVPRTKKLSKAKAFQKIKTHWKDIEKSDALLVVNFKQRRQKGYISGKSFLEMGYAFVLGKDIYLYNQIPIYHHNFTTSHHTTLPCQFHKS